MGALRNKKGDKLIRRWPMDFIPRRRISACLNIEAWHTRNSSLKCVYLHDRRDVDGVPRRSCGGERSLGLGRVSQGVVHPRLYKVRLHQQLLVVHALQLPEELVEQRHGVLVLALLEKLAKIVPENTAAKNKHAWMMISCSWRVIAKKTLVWQRESRWQLTQKETPSVRGTEAKNESDGSCVDCNRYRRAGLKGGEEHGLVLQPVWLTKHFAANQRTLIEMA